MPDVVVTRVQHFGGPKPSRDLDERFMVRFPGVYRLLAALALRLLRPRSRLRRMLLARHSVSGYGAASRRDDELVLVRYAADFEVEFDPDFEPLGLGGTFRGHDGFVRMMDTFAEAWQRWEFQPVAIVDMGDQLVALNRLRVIGAGSGVQLERDFVQFRHPPKWPDRA